MKTPTHRIAATAMLLACTFTEVTLGQTPADPATPAPHPEWQVALEQAVFARNYGGDDAKTQALFARALQSALASGDQGAAEKVRRELAGDSDTQDPGTEKILGRMLSQMSQFEGVDRTTKIRQTSWRDYVLDEASARIIARCLDGPAAIGGQPIRLRIEDVLSIAGTIKGPPREIIHRLALNHRDPLVRLRAVEARDVDLELIKPFLVDTNPLVRRAACDRLDNEQDPTLAPLFLRALDMETEAAVRPCLGFPGIVERIQSAVPTSWLARTLAQPDFAARSNAVSPEHSGMANALLDWAEATDTPDAARWIALATTCLPNRNGAGREAAADRIVALAKLRSEQFDATIWHTSLGSLIESLGDVDDLVELAPLWNVGDQRSDADFRQLFKIATDSPSDTLDKLIKLGVDLVQAASAESASMDRAGDYWHALGERRWTPAEADALRRALSALAAMPEEGRQWVRPHFVAGVAQRTNPEAIFDIMEPHYAALCAGENFKAFRRKVSQVLVQTKSQHAPSAALALGNDLPKPETYLYGGDFLIAAFAAAPDAACKAVVATGMTQSSTPAVALGPYPNHPGWQRVVASMPDGLEYWQPPSILWFLPADQAATAALRLWKDKRWRGTERDLVDLLLFARESRYALGGLVERFDQLEESATQARVLTVLGEMLYRPARPLIANALESEEPALRHAALAAAQPFIAYQQARAALTEDPQTGGK